MFFGGRHRGRFGEFLSKNYLQTKYNRKSHFTVKTSVNTYKKVSKSFGKMQKITNFSFISPNQFSEGFLSYKTHFSSYVSKITLGGLCLIIKY